MKQFMAHVIKVELPPGTNLLVTHGSAESGEAPSQDLPSRQPRQRPSRPVDPGYGVDVPEGEPNQDLPPQEQADIKAKLEEAKKAVNAKIDEIKNRPPPTGSPSHDLPNRLEAAKEAARAKIDELKQQVPEYDTEEVKAKIAAKVDEVKKAIGARIPPDLSQKLEGLKQQIASAIEQAKAALEGRGEGSGNCGAKLDEAKAAVSAKLEELKAAFGSKGQDVSNAIEEAKAALEAKIEEIKASVGDPNQDLPAEEETPAQQPAGRPPIARHR